MFTFLLASFTLHFHKGPFTLGGIPAVSARHGTLPSACCVYIRQETGGKPLASVMQMIKRVFNGNRISCVVIFTFAKRRRRQRRQNKRQRRVWVHDTLHWEPEWCRRIMHTCTRTMGPTAMTTDFSNMSEFHKRSLRIFYRYLNLNVTISRKPTIKFKQPIFSSHVYHAYEVTGLHMPAGQRHVIN